MKTNLEIEFKTKISEEIYNNLMKEYNLEKQILTQINYYFETEDNFLKNNKITLRIRQKGEQYKLTSKLHTDEGTQETHIYLTKNDALKMIENGFNAHIIGFPHYVKNIAKLQTERVSFLYKKGKMFFDKNTYYGNTDYEIEFEADSKDEGKIIFLNFLKEKNIPYEKLKSKSYRAISKAQETK